MRGRRRNFSRVLGTQGNNPWADADVALGFAAATAGGDACTTKQGHRENAERAL